MHHQPREAQRRPRLPQPLARTALLAAPGGVVVGALIGIVYSLISTVPELLFRPAWAGGTGSAGFTVDGALLGLVIGAVFGLVAGPSAAGALALAFAAGVPRLIACVVGCSALAAAAFGMTLIAFGPDPPTLLVPSLGSAQGAGGVILLSWGATLRPRDYAEAVAARTHTKQLG